ncbi:DUF4062 domain-containing protein [Fusobacterium varium]|uniref:DUF4062 domain-containing protein n=1 Tax=Fusobacterium varium TaxID=856 RepID=UPI0022E0FD25|nr:DUF4062 domain-containing protein [Fusobacterium varium]
MAKYKKYQIFISSTYLDLIEERQMAVQSIIKMGHIPAGMELFKAGASQWQTITKWIDESDIYVLILGGRYGTLNEHEGKSYTHLEYEYALSTGMPVFALVLEDEFLQKKEKNETVEIFEKNNIKLYNEFKKLVQSKIVKFIEDIKDIQIEMQDNIHTIAEERKLEGWSKGSDTENYIGALEENSSLLKENQKLMKENQKLKEKIQKLEEDKKEKFSCGLTFEELFDTLQNIKIKIPKGMFNFNKDISISLLDISIQRKSSLARGLSNSGLSNPAVIFLHNKVASELVTYGLCDVKKASGVATWSTITLNSEGKKFFAIIDKKKRKI